MSEPTGYILLSRKLFKSDLWLQKRVFSDVEAWIDIIQTAQWRDRVFETEKFGAIELKRGEFIGSVRRFEKRWKWSKSKVGRFLEANRKLGRIVGQRSGRYGTVYLVANYDSYQLTPENLGQKSGQTTGQKLGQERIQVLPNTSNSQLTGSDSTPDSASPPKPSALDRLPKDSADKAFTTWGSRLGVVNYAQLRKVLLDCVDAGIPHDQLADAVDAYADFIEGLDERELQFNRPSPEKFATEAQRWARLGLQGYATLHGLTERGKLLTRHVKFA